MPLDHSRRFDEYQGFEDLRPHSVKPDPQEPVGGKEPKSVWALPAHDDHLMSQCDKLEFQRRSAAKTEREEGDESEQDRNHLPEGMETARGNCGFLDVSTILSKDSGA